MKNRTNGLPPPLSGNCIAVRNTAGFYSNYHNLKGNYKLHEVQSGKTFATQLRALPATANIPAASVRFNTDGMQTTAPARRDMFWSLPPARCSTATPKQPSPNIQNASAPKSIPSAMRAMEWPVPAGYAIIPCARDVSALFPARALLIATAAAGSAPLKNAVGRCV